MEKFLQRLETWQDSDIAMYFLAAHIGVVDDAPDGDYSIFHKHKGLFCSSNKTSKNLGFILSSLIDLDILEAKPDENCYRRKVA